MREIKLSRVDLQVFYHLQNLFEYRYTIGNNSYVQRCSIDIKDGLVQFVNSKRNLAFQYKTQSDFKDFIFPNIKQFSEMRSLCGANSKIFIDDNRRLTIKNKTRECNFNENKSLNLKHPNTHHIKNQIVWSKEEDDICFNISSLEFEDIRQRYQNFSKNSSKIEYMLIFTNIASEIIFAFEKEEHRHTYFHNTVIKSNKDFYIILKRDEHPFKYLLKDNYEVRIKKVDRNLDAMISFHNLSIPLITVISCKQKEKNYCSSGDFNEVVTGFKPIQEELKIEKTQEPVSTKLEGVERFYK